ncbi:MAG: hypothetical protein EA411_04740 [Saprospirales bacterium]|nr:MAG: hypothetical protein EA411_04740 [Saprospirales bacterium]
MEKIFDHPALKDEKLKWMLSEGLETHPLHQIDPEKSPEKSLAFQEPENDWKFILPFRTDENQALLNALSSGLQSVEFEYTENFYTDLLKLLEGVHPKYIELHFALQRPEQAGKALSDLMKFCKKQKITPGEFTGTLRSNTGSPAGLIDPGLAAQFSGISTLFFSAPHTGVEKKRSFQLTEIFRSLLNTMEHSNEDDAEFLKRSYFRLYLDNDLLADMVKIRAFNLIWALITDETGAGAIKPNLEVAISPGAFGKDPYNNLIAATSLSIGAITSGAGRIYFPHIPLEKTEKLRDPATFSRRMTLNISHILRLESHFNKVVDPLAGSHFFETQATRIAEEAWEKITS